MSANRCNNPLHEEPSTDSLATCEFTYDEWPFVRTLIATRKSTRRAIARRCCSDRDRRAAVGGLGEASDPRPGAGQPFVVVGPRELDVHSGDRPDGPWPGRRVGAEAGAGHSGGDDRCVE